MRPKIEREFWKVPTVSRTAPPAHMGGRSWEAGVELASGRGAGLT